MKDDITHFGYRKVSKSEKADLVGAVFSSVASRYDLMNDCMSLGVHRLWKRYAAWLCAVKSGQRILDLAGGTGDMALQLHAQLGGEGEIVIADISGEMLEAGRARLLDRGVVSGRKMGVSFVRCDAQTMPFGENRFDRVVLAFGLRNMVEKQRALAAVYHVLKPGGRFVILEFSKPAKWLEPLYDAWSFGVIPRLGRKLADDEGSYRYLVESIRMHPGQEELLGMMDKAGFERCRYFNLSHGIAAVHRGCKL